VGRKPLNNAKMPPPCLKGRNKVDIKPIQPTDNIHFGILKGVKKRPYGDYLWGEYKGKKIEVYDAKEFQQLLIYVSETMRFVKSKLIYFQDGVKKIIRAEGK
jgi:hypothetical protein